MTRRQTQSNKESKLCAYCRTAGALTKDHIPPKSLFRTPRPQNTITVPACSTCNSAFALDDDYFCLHLSARVETGSDPAARDASARAVKNLARKEATGFRNVFLRTTREVEVHSPEGIYLGNSMSYEVNFERLNRTAARIVKGLYMHVTGQPLPANYVACALFSESLIAENQNTYVRMLEHLNAAEPHSVGSVFE